MKISSMIVTLALINLGKWSLSILSQTKRYAYVKSLVILDNLCGLYYYDYKLRGYRA